MVSAQSWGVPSAVGVVIVDVVVVVGVVIVDVVVVVVVVVYRVSTYVGFHVFRIPLTRCLSCVLHEPSFSRDLFWVSAPR